MWGPAAQAFFEEAAFYNHYNERDIDRYHWNTAKFKTLWRTKFAVLMARERGTVLCIAWVDGILVQEIFKELSV